MNDQYHIWSSITGAASGFLVAVLTALSISKRLENKVGKDAFKEYKISIDKQFKNVCDDLTEIKNDVKSLLKKS